MTFLLFGANGMLGRTVYAYLKSKGYEVIPLCRKDYEVSSLDLDRLEALFDKHEIKEGDWVINCVGAIPQRVSQADDPGSFVRINAIFPHLLASLCKQRKTILFHPTTDCVYSGTKGSSYLPDDPHDERSIYGLSKSCGEPPSAMVLRTSILGEESGSGVSFLEWVRKTIGQGKEIGGFTKHFWNGVTCLQVAKLIEESIQKGIYWSGVQVVGSEPLSKFDLVKLIAKAYKLEDSLRLVPKETSLVDKTLVPTSPSLFAPLPSLKTMVVDQAKFWGKRRC